MKKVLAITLTMAILFTMTAMAVTTITEMGDSSNPVTATYSGNNGGGTIYSVDITWGSLEYTYNAANKGAWDPETHTYKDISNASWSCDEGADTITVTNHSNAGVSVSMKYEQSESYTNITGTLDNPNFELATAENTEVNDAPSNKATLKLSGDLAENADNVQVGTVTVTIGGSSNSNETDDTQTSMPVISSLEPVGNTDMNTLMNSGLKINVQGENLGQITTESLSEYVYITIDIDNISTDITGRATYSAKNDEEATITIANAVFMGYSTFDNLKYEIK